MRQIQEATKYRGRFAPTPSGMLHFGSLVTAVGSYLDARSHQGEWLVRIEDVDHPRVKAGISEKILSTLERFGMEWDGPIVYQSKCMNRYYDALHFLETLGLTYPCSCTRKEIADSALLGLEGMVYPGHCRNGLPPDHNQRPQAVRIKTKPDRIEFQDRLQGSVYQSIANEIGDFVLRRADGIYTYQLAVVADDGWQSITHIVRGADLLASTPRQIFLQRLLGYPTPSYLHLPVVTTAQGEKLSKQTLAHPIDTENPLLQLMAAIDFLGQYPPSELIEGDLNSFWQWAINHWSVARIAQVTYAPYNPSLNIVNE